MTNPSSSLIRRFLVNSEVYEHVIFPNTDDRVECRNMDGDVILTYDAHGIVSDKHKRHVGRFKISGGDWVFEYSSEQRFLRFAGGNLLEAEIGVSEMYIRGEL